MAFAVPRGWTREIGRRMLVVAVGLAAWSLLAPSAADARDPDGTRLGAKRHEVGAEDTGSLEPPEDSSDWRYVELEEERRVEFGLERTSGSESPTLRLTEATGEELESATTSGGVAEFERVLRPGIYYFEVSCSEAVGYSVDVR